MNDIGIEKYRLQVLVQNEKLDIPVFQRKFRWSPAKQKELINSIKNEYPIGVITTYVDSDNTFVLDGLQRLTTIKRFLANPRFVFNWPDLYSYKFLEPLLKYISSLKSNKRLIQATLKKIYAGLIENDPVLKRFTAFKEKFLSYNPTMNIEEDILEEIFIKFTDIFKLDSLVPVIEYKGDIENVADIFEKMNTGSVTLSKYEVFAASWSNYQTEVPENEYDVLAEHYLKYSYILNNKFKDEFNIEKHNNSYNISELYVVMSYKILNEANFEDIQTVVPKIFIGKYYEEDILYKDEFFHEIFSGFSIGMPTRIDKYVKDNFLNGGLNFDWDYVKFINDFSKYVIDHIDKIVTVFKKAGFSKGKPNTLNYLFLFVLISSLLITIKASDNSISIRGDSEALKSLSKEVFDVKRLISERWFKDEYRQVGFLNDKLELVKSIIDTDIFTSIHTESKKINFPSD